MVQATKPVFLKTMQIDLLARQSFMSYQTIVNSSMIRIHLLRHEHRAGTRIGVSGRSSKTLSTITTATGMRSFRVRKFSERSLGRADFIHGDHKN